MIRNIKNVIKSSLLLLSGSFLLWSCESEADDLGTQFFEANSAQGIEKSFDIIAYNIGNNDSVRTDGNRLTYASLGAFKENKFGSQKIHYVTQARLNTYAPSLGTSPVVDSVVLEINPLYATDSVTTTTVEEYFYSSESIPSKKVVNTYPITKYGKIQKDITLNVHRVEDFLGSTSDEIYSNKTVNYSTLLGSLKLNGKVSAVTVTKDSDNSELLKRDARIRIPLDVDFFQNNIVNKASDAELADVSNFIRYFKGVRISTAEDDGYIFNFIPANTQIVVYYNYQSTATDGTVSKRDTSFSINLGTDNTRFNQIEYDRTGTPSANYSSLSTVNYTTGDAKIYTQGMGGPKVGIRIPDETIAELKQLYKNNKIGLLSAKVRLYTDTEEWNNNYTKPTAFSTHFFDKDNLKTDLSTYLQDMQVFTSTQMVYGYKLTENPAYYEVTLTQTLKNIIEETESNKDIVLSIGDFEKGSTGAYLGTYRTSKAYTPNRVVLVGTDAQNSNRVQLRIKYASK